MTGSGRHLSIVLDGERSPAGLSAAAPVVIAANNLWNVFVLSKRGDNLPLMVSELAYPLLDHWILVYETHMRGEFN